MKHLKLTKLLQKTGLIILISTALFLILINKIQIQDERTYEPPSNGLGNQCRFVNLECEIELEDLTFRFSLNKEIETEERITVSIMSDSIFKVEGISIKGVNMYMGMLPVVEENVTPYTWQGWFMLGSCSEPSMLWQLTVKIKGVSEHAELTFITTG